MGERLCIKTCNKGGFNKLPWLSSVGSQTADGFLWWHLTVSSPCPHMPCTYTHSQMCTCTIPHTHTGVKGKRIHSDLASCTLFHLVPNNEWSLNPGMDTEQAPSLTMKHTHQRHSHPVLKTDSSVAAISYHTCSNCQILHLGGDVEDFFTMAIIVSVLLFEGARVESLRRVV